ncbi:HXXEE domain-containing protein [Paenibacillus polymyxa]|uniref:HXXEE domain-containing protein n=1 Tax=Paenibacillus polymyxa TaxID=1406 RepID=UPI002AB4D561|nr:HXXEE domain-containing protein [Paenibacillus polymyxa]MDY7993308.1 HXXEE domain-containing protein [Paenibacillus polymyxa]MDY8120091.1 HXXEE domain-containing protein [Paenibacillus polymyxa]
MNFLRKYWQDAGAIIGVVVCIVLLMNPAILSDITGMLWLSFVAILFHQFEEYRWPGYFAGLFNNVMFKSDTPDHYPLNTQSAMIINVAIAYVFYLLPVWFPQVIWLGLAPVFMGFFQVVWHGIVVNIKAKTLYNPGLFTALLLHVPVGIRYIHEIVQRDIPTAIDWIAGTIYFVFAVYIFIIKGNIWLKKSDSPYSFSKQQLGAYGRK